MKNSAIIIVLASVISQSSLAEENQPSKDQVTNTKQQSHDLASCVSKNEFVPRMMRIQMRIHFENNVSSISAKYNSDLAKVADFLIQHPSANLHIEGHASKTGPSSLYNQRLSEQRASMVKAFFTNQYNIRPSRIAAMGWGYDRPIGNGETAEDLAFNRRVYMTASYMEAPPADPDKECN